MKDNELHSKLRESSWRRKLTEAEQGELRVYLAAHPDARTDWEMESALNAALARLPRDSSATRSNSRCQLTGRSKAYLRRFKVSRIMLRELALAGKIPGLKKASW